MTGRGRPRKAMSPDTMCAKSKTRPEEMKQESLPRCPGKQNGTTKEQKPKAQKKTTHAEEKPSLQRTQIDKTKNHLTEELKRQRTPTETTKAPVQGAKAKTCAGRAKTTEQSAEEITKTKPETPKDATKDSLKTTKAKKCGGKAKSPEQLSEELEVKPEVPKAAIKSTKAKTCAGRAKTTEQSAEEITKMKPERPKDTTKDSQKTTKEKKCGGKAKSPEQLSEELEVKPKVPKDTTKAVKAKTCAGKTKSPDKISEETTKMQPGTPEHPKKAGRCKDKAPVDSILNTTLKDLKIKRDARSDAAGVINKLTEAIIAHLKKNTECFKEVEPLRTGSYYENLKISNPDEFDVMLTIPVDRVKVTPYRDDGAFYSVELKRGNSPLNKFGEAGPLPASEMLKEFRDEVKKCVKQFEEWEVTRKKKGCPAVTLTTTVKSITISLDVVLSLMVKSSWPPFTKEGIKIDGWLGTKVKRDYKRMPYYLVPKYEGNGAAEIDGVFARDTWRVSFSHVEKAILKNHGSEKTCCETGGAPCCRKDCLKLLKHLLSLLKEEDSSFDKFCSYHAKTTLLHACCSRNKDSDWSASSLSHCFQLLLKDFVAHLEKGVLYNFFIPTHNLLSDLDQKKCNNLARRIMDECDKGFPIFK